jgi:hypothetical protein
VTEISFPVPPAAGLFSARFSRVYVPAPQVVSTAEDFMEEDSMVVGSMAEGTEDTADNC